MRFFRRTDRAAGEGPIESNGITIFLGQKEPDTVITVSGRVTIESSPCLRSLLLRKIRSRRSAVIVVDLG